MDREALGSWLNGPGALERAPEPGSYRGERLGLPESGVGSLASLGPRVLALLVDWILAGIITAIIVPGMDQMDPARPWIHLAVFLGLTAILTVLTGSSAGHRLVGIGVMREDFRRINLLQAVGRATLICLVIPTVVWDRDGRGLQDRLCRTVLVRRR